MKLPGAPDQFGSFLNINLGYGLALMLGVYASIGVSGGHLNPAVTLAMAVRGQLSWLKVCLSPSLSFFLPPSLSLSPSRATEQVQQT